jgi:Zn-dependent protease
MVMFPLRISRAAHGRVPLVVQPGFVVVALLNLYAMRKIAHERLGLDLATANRVALVSAALFALSIVLHELGHALVAHAERRPVLAIVLNGFGGGTLIPPGAGPWGEFRIMLGGPLVTAALAAVGVLAAWTTRDAASLAGVLTVDVFALMNLALLAYNLLPAPPLDGGRLIQAAVWARTGRQPDADRVVAVIGFGVGALLAAAAAWVLVAQDDVIGLIVLGGSAWMAGAGSRRALRHAKGFEAVARRPVSAALLPQPITAPASLSPRRAWTEYFAQYPGLPDLPLLDDDSRPVGRAPAEAVEAARHDERRTVADYARPVGTIASDAPIAEALRRPEMNENRFLFVVGPDGRFIGLTRLSQIETAAAQLA